MVFDRVDVFSDIGILLVCLIVGLGGMAALTMIALRSYRLSHPLLGWFGIFLTARRREKALLVFFICRFPVGMAVLFTDSFVSVPLLCYVFLAVAVCVCLRSRRQLLFEGLYSVEMIAVFWLFQLLKDEATRGQVPFGTGVLVWLAGIFLFGMLIGQFLCAIPKLLSDKKTMEAYQSQTTEEKLTEKRMKYLFVLPLVFIVFPAIMLTRVTYVYCDVPVYQIHDGKTTAYETGGKVRQGEDGCILVQGNQTVPLENSLLLFEEEERLLFCSVYSVVQPTLQLSNRVRTMSVLQREGDGYTITYNGDAVELEDFFLFDGKDTYVFPSGTSLQWEEESLELSTAALVTVKYNQYMEIYVLGSEEQLRIPMESGYCMAVLESRTQVNMSTDIMYREYGQEQMLFMQPSLLSDLE